MQSFRNAKQLARFALVWFALLIGVAVISPMVNPQVMSLVCSGGGGAHLVIAGSDDHGAGPHSHTLDCPLCAMVSAPPPQYQVANSFSSPLSVVLQRTVAAHIAVMTAPPLPSRGPPTLFL